MPLSVALLFHISGPKLLHLAIGETVLKLNQSYSQDYWLALGIPDNAVFIAFLMSVMKHLK